MTSRILLSILFFIFGLVFGSFYNVVGIRVPKGESIVAPPFPLCDLWEHYQRIPNVILFPSIALLMIIRMFTHPLGIATYLIGAVAGFGVLLAIAVISKGGMGYGDVKLFFFVGLFTGLAGAILTLFLSSIFGTVIGLSMRGMGKLKPRQPFPFGPSIGLAAILVYLYGSQWLTLYFHLL